ncbi:MAG: type IX secretion system membrane protein PorP/SprF [Crocinitomicaceae bacterium]|nr:type IX secretion system membrane protein PorP/SprF [Crocinitomicaceae bacterium]
MKWLVIFVILSSYTCLGQQSPQYSQYIQNQYMLNPAAVGTYDFTNISVGGRMQWLGIENAPMSSYAYVSAPAGDFRTASMKRTFGKLRRGNKRVKHPKLRLGTSSHAFGGHVLADQYGPYRQFKAMGTYAYHLPINQNYSISFGTNVGLSNRAFITDKAQVLSVLTNTGQFDQTYDSYAASQGAQFNLEVDGGIYFYGENAFLGISSTQLTQDLVKFGNREFNFSPERHWYFSGGGKFVVNRKMSTTLALLVKYVKPAPISIEATIQFDYDERFWYGFSYRHKDALVAMFGATVNNQFKIGYSFDLNVSRLIKYNVGSHELVMTFMLGRSKF